MTQCCLLIESYIIASQHLIHAKTFIKILFVPGTTILIWAHLRKGSPYLWDQNIIKIKHYDFVPQSSKRVTLNLVITTFNRRQPFVYRWCYCQSVTALAWQMCHVKLRQHWRIWTTLENRWKEEDFLFGIIMSQNIFLDKSRFKDFSDFHQCLNVCESGKFWGLICGSAIIFGTAYSVETCICSVKSELLSDYESSSNQMPNPAQLTPFKVEERQLHVAPYPTYDGTLKDWAILQRSLFQTLVPRIFC